MTGFITQNKNEVIVSVLFIILLLAFLDPFMIFMPSSAVYVALVGLVVLFIAYASFIWREHAKDEREELHRMIAGRAGYLFGTGVLLFGVLWQTMQGHVDPWLVCGLAAMIGGKLAGLIWSNLRR